MVGVCEVGLAKWGFKISHTFFLGGGGGGGKGERGTQTTKFVCLFQVKCNFSINPLSANSTKWSNKLQQFVGYCQQICLKIPLIHFMALFSLYAPWNTSENQGLDFSRGHRKRTMSRNGLRVVWSSVSYLVIYICNWRFIQLKSFWQNEIINFPHLICTAKLSLVMLIKLFLIFLTLLVVFSSSLKHA